MNALDALHSSMRLSILMISLMMTTSLQAAQQVSLGVRGAAVPYLVSPAGDASGMNGMGASIQTNIPGSEVDSSDTSVGISLADPVAGAYGLSLAGPYPETLGLSLGFYDSATDKQYTRTYRALYHGGTLGLTFLMDPNQDSPVDLLSSAGEPVIATVSLSGSGTVTLSWFASSESDVVKYRVYRRLASTPVFQQVAELTGLSFDTGDQLQSVSGDADTVHGGSRHGDRR